MSGINQFSKVGGSCFIEPYWRTIIGENSTELFRNWSLVNLLCIFFRTPNLIYIFCIVALICSSHVRLQSNFTPNTFIDCLVISHVLRWLFIGIRQFVLKQIFWEHIYSHHIKRSLKFKVYAVIHNIRMMVKSQLFKKVRKAIFYSLH